MPKFEIYPLHRVWSVHTSCGYRLLIKDQEIRHFFKPNFSLCFQWTWWTIRPFVMPTGNKWPDGTSTFRLIPRRPRPPPTVKGPIHPPLMHISTTTVNIRMDLFRRVPPILASQTWTIHPTLPHTIQTEMISPEWEDSNRFTLITIGSHLNNNSFTNWERRLMVS